MAVREMLKEIANRVKVRNIGNFNVFMYVCSYMHYYVAVHQALCTYIPRSYCEMCFLVVLILLMIEF